MVPMYTGNWLAAWCTQGVGVIADNTQFCLLCTCLYPGTQHPYSITCRRLQVEGLLSVWYTVP